MTNTPRMVPHRIETLWPGDLEGNLSKVKQKIEELIKEHGPTAFFSYEEGYDGDWNYRLYIERLETPEEVDRRIKAEKASEERRLDYERQEYERLKAKFEKGAPA